MSPDDVFLGNATLAMSICSSSLGNTLAAEEGSAYVRTYVRTYVLTYVNVPGLAFYRIFYAPS